MKKSVFIISVLMATLVAFSIGCKKDPTEECVNQKFCDGVKDVTACCTDGADCVYTYNGIDYPDTDKGMADLLKALDCAKSKSEEVGGYESLEDQLTAMLEKARQLSMQ